MNVLSLFDGISCGRLALQRASLSVNKYFASEIDKHAIKVTQKNFPDTIQLGDVRDIRYDKGVLITPKGNHPFKLDLLIGGSPCQGFASGGRRLNFDDPRSSLFFEFVRLKTEVKPKFFLLENVPMKQANADIISEYLGVQPLMINSALVSGQNRKRLYWTNIPVTGLPEDKGILLSSVLESGTVEKEKSNVIDANYHKAGSVINYIKKLEAGIPIKQSESRLMVADTGTFRILSPVECERLQTIPDGYTEGISRLQRHKCLGNAWTVDVIAHIFSFLPLDSL